MAFDILLINPPYKSGGGFNREGRCTQEAGFWATPWPPYSLAMLGAVLRPAHRVRVLDCPAQKMTDEKLLADVAGHPPDILIAAVSTETIESDLAVLASLKTRAPKTIIVIFGVHATIYAAELVGGSVDYVIRNEPEETARELIAALAAGADPSGVAGVTGRSAAGAVVSAPDRPFLRDLDSLPFPAWDLIDLGRYRLPLSRRKFIMVNTLRGCPFGCTFCNARVYYGTAARARSAASVLDEVRTSLERYRVRNVFFWSDTFTLVRAHVRELCEEFINAGLHFRWVANSRVDTVDTELLRLMKKAGCWMVSFGLESADDEILARAGKKITRAQTEESVRAAHAAGLMVAGHFMIGLPGETASTARETVRLARRLPLDFAHFYAAVPVPGSSLFDEAERAGRLRGMPWDRFRQSAFVLDVPGLSAEELYRHRRKAYHAFYFRPRTLRTAVRTITAR
jgi:anaerobic magnesium-protoporphyrin IX monomethyl ester cyclase